MLEIEAFFDSVSKELTQIGLHCSLVSEIEPAQKQQVHNPEKLIAILVDISSPVALPVTYSFELHLGRYEEHLQIYLRIENISEFHFRSNLSASNYAEDSQNLIAKSIGYFLAPKYLPSSIEDASLGVVEASVLPTGFRAVKSQSDVFSVDILDTNTNLIVANYIFRDYKLYRSSPDDLFDPIKRMFKLVPTHNLGLDEMRGLSPNDWAHLVRAWISKDFFYNLPYLVDSDFAFEKFGKELVRLPKSLPKQLRVDWKLGFQHWVTKVEVMNKVKYRQKWRPDLEN